MANLVETSKVGELAFEGTASFDDGSDTTYGGHLLAQASYSASQTVADSEKGFTLSLQIFCKLVYLERIIYER